MPLPRRTDADPPAILCAAAALARLLMPVYTLAQELEPGAYRPIPTGPNIVTVVNSFNFTGGQTTIGWKQNVDRQLNSRIGATFRQRSIAARRSGCQ